MLLTASNTYAACPCRARPVRPRGFVAHILGKARASPWAKGQPQAHGVGHGQDVAEQNGGVQRVALQRLQRDLGGVIAVGGQAHEAAGLGAGGAVLGQVAPGLAHQPQRRVGRGAAQAGLQEGGVVQGGKARSSALRLGVVGWKHSFPIVAACGLIPSLNHPCRCCFVLPCSSTVCGFAPGHE